MSQTEDFPLTWKTSTYSDSTSCLEWARPAGALVRDTKCRERAVVPVSAPVWRGFVDWVKTETA